MQPAGNDHARDTPEAPGGCPARAAIQVVGPSCALAPVACSPCKDPLFLCGDRSRRHPPAHLVTGLKLVFSVCARTNGDRKLAGLAGHRTLEAQHVTETAVTSLVEGAGEPNVRLHPKDHAVSGDLAGRPWILWLSTCCAHLAHARLTSGLAGSADSACRIFSSMVRTTSGRSFLKRLQ